MPTKAPTTLARAGLLEPKPRVRVAENDEGFYSRAQWRKLRAMVLHRHPLCADPFGHHAEDGEIPHAEHVHHVVPRLEAPDLAYEMSNLQSLCVRCHSRLEARTCTHDRGGLKV